MRKHVVALLALLFAGGTASAGFFHVPHLRFHPSRYHPHTNSSIAVALHRAHEQRAILDIEIAIADAKAGRVRAAEIATAAAAAQVNAAIGYHSHHSFLHKHHHTHLTTALADLRVSEKQFQTGRVGTAEKDLVKAGQQIADALKHHQ